MNILTVLGYTIWMKIPPPPPRKIYGITIRLFHVENIARILERGSILIQEKVQQKDFFFLDVFN